MVDYGDVNDPNRIWNIPEDWQKLPLNREYWNHSEVMTLRGRMIVITQRKSSRHPPFQFATAISKRFAIPDFEPSDHLLTAQDVSHWEGMSASDGFSEDEITSAMEFIQTG